MPFLGRTLDRGPTNIPDPRTDKLKSRDASASKKELYISRDVEYNSNLKIGFVSIFGAMDIPGPRCWNLDNSQEGKIEFWFPLLYTI